MPHIIDPKYKKLLDRAKIGLMSHGSVFIITIAFNLRYEWTDEIPTLAVDGLTIFINPKFFESLSEELRISAIAHETWHVAFDHILRRGNLDPKIWNFAGDYVINLMLQQAGFTIGKDWLLNTKYNRWATEKVYNDIFDEMKNSPAMSGGIGIDIQEPKEQKKKDEVVANIKNIMVKAISQSKMAGEKPGTVPSEIERGIDELLNPVLPWQTLLQNFLTEKTKDDYTWQRPNKRYMPEFYLPTQYSESLNHLTFAIDTSGSVSNEMMIEILSEIVYIKEAFNPKKMTILDCDRIIHNIHEVEECDDILDLKFSGGGGTAFEPVIEFCKERETNALLYFTDLYGKLITEDPGFPMLWLCYSNHKPAPIGETIYYEQ